MSKRPLTNAERLHYAFCAGIGVFVVHAIAYKLGHRGKYYTASSPASWSEVVAHLPGDAVAALLIAGGVYFWLGRRGG